MKTLYFDCFAGASGNMILGALVALGVDEKELVEQIKLLDVADFAIEFTTRDKSGIAAVHAEVVVPYEHAHRHLRHIEKIINDSRLADSVKKRAVEIFRKLAEAEAKIHGIEIGKVHFHEVGAMDAIIDVVGACVGFELLGIDRFACSRIHVGSGFVQMAHGKYPVPPPAVAELLKDAPIYSTEIEGELITPTGAAIIATVCDRFGGIPFIKTKRTAYGAGTREHNGFPNVLRLILGEEDSAYTFYTPSDDTNKGESYTNAELYAEALLAQADYAEKLEKEETENVSNLINTNLILLETNIDDFSPQNLGFVMERAFELDCLDCWFTPIQMKKNRPATMISILCSPEKKELFTKLLYTETTTLGVRVSEIERSCLPREVIQVETAFGVIDVKIARFGGEIVNVKPEYEQMREFALQSNVSLREVEKKITEKLNASAQE